MADRERLNEALGLVNNIFTRPNVVTALSEMVDQRRDSSTGAASNVSIDAELQRAFRPGSGASESSSAASLRASVMPPRYQTQHYFGGWTSKSRKRTTVQNHPAFNKDLILLPYPEWGDVCKHKSKRRLQENGFILNAFEMKKNWDFKTVIVEIREAFKDKIPDEVSIELLMPCGNKLVPPKLSEGQELNGFIVHKVFKSKAVYIRPSSILPVPFDSSDSEDGVLADTTSTPSDHRLSSQTRDCMTTRARGNQIASSLQVSSYPVTRSGRASQSRAVQQALSPSMTRETQSRAVQQALSPSMTRETQSRAVQQAPSVIGLDNFVSQTPTASNEDYAAYLSIMTSMSDHSSDDEELNQAITASLETNMTVTHPNTKSAQEVLLNLAAQINSNQRCRFNINRSSVLDGAIRGFKRFSYSPTSQMCVKFSDDLGMDEEAVDLGGPRREFLRLLMEALALSPMFEGRDNKLSLALDSTALREDCYFIAGQAIAVSLVHGGPSPGFLAPTLYSCIVGDNSSVKPVFQDIADADLYEKVKKVSECSSLDELLHITEPLQDYLANAGCLRPLKCIEDRDLLVQDITMFQVVHRVAGALERFKEGLKVLGVLDAIRMHPESFRALMCHEPSALTADIMDNLFQVRLSEVGSNKRRAEELVVPFWRDYLQDVEVGFSPKPSIDFLHQHSSSPKQRLPMANTCINCLKLPLLDTYEDFRKTMDFAISNTQGFGRE